MRISLEGGSRSTEGGRRDAEGVGLGLDWEPKDAMCSQALE